MGAVLGKSHTHVQRVEDARAPVPLRDARAWLDATEAEQDTRDTVLALVRASAEETESWRAGKGHIQAEAAARIEAADAVDSFQPFVIPGLLQTEAYCRWVGVPDGWDLEEHVAARIARQSALRSGQRFRFVIRRRAYEAADTEQQAKVWNAVSDTVAIRILDDAARFGTATIGFLIYIVGREDAAVGMELPHGRHEVTEPEKISVYRELWTAMWDASQPVRAAS